MKYALIFFLLLIVPVSATYSEKIHDDWLVHGESIEVHGENLSASYSIDGQKAYIDYGGLSIIVENDSCRAKENKNFCALMEEDFINYTQDRQYYKGKIGVYAAVSLLSISRVSDTNAMVGEEFSVNVNIQNSDENDATDVVFIERVPASFIIHNPKGCSIEDDNLVFRGTIRKNENLICSYKLIPKQTGNYSIKTELTYNNEEETITRIDEQDIRVTQKDLILNSKLERDQLEVGMETDLEFNLTNFLNESLTITQFRIELPYTLEVTHASYNLEEQVDGYIWVGHLNKNSSEEFILKIKSIEEGVSSIKTYIDYNSFGERRIEENEMEILTILPGLDYQFEIDKKEISEEHNATLYFSIENPSIETTITNITINLSSNYPGIDFYKEIEELRADRTRNLLSQLLSPLPSSEDVEYHFNLSIDYFTPDGRVTEIDEIFLYQLAFGDEEIVEEDNSSFFKAENVVDSGIPILLYVLLAFILFVTLKIIHRFRKY
ncbi:hypothetical protein ACFLZX_00405 [Nanoarchaeota archaeon]